jgi:hypothetical protein
MSETLKLNHIRFLSDDKPVCHWPARLGHDFVYNTRLRRGEERNCEECRQLVLAHNIKERLDENHGVMYRPEDTTPAKGLVYGLLFASLFWAIVIVLFFAFR